MESGRSGMSFGSNERSGSRCPSENVLEGGRGERCQEDQILFMLSVLLEGFFKFGPL